MKAHNLDLWTKQTVELRETEAGAKFLDFFEFWFDGADRILDQEQWCDDNRQPTTGISPAGAMRMALQAAEHEMGFLSVDWIGQMLAVAVQHWTHGGLLAAGLSLIEHRVMEEALARKIAQLAEDAKLPANSQNQ